MFLRLNMKIIPQGLQTNKKTEKSVPDLSFYSFLPK